MHEWEESKTGIKKHYRKILYPTLGVALAGTTTAAVALPIMIKKIATQKTMDLLSKILPISDQVNSLKDNVAVKERGGKVNYLAIGDSVTAGFNGYLSSNGVIEKDVLTNPVHAHNTNLVNPSDPSSLPAENAPHLSNYVAIKHEIDEIDALLKGTTLTPEQRIEKEQLRKFLVTQMEDKAQHTTGDYLSFADFLANDLQKAGKLNDYRNFALTGATMPNLRQTMLRNTTALACIKQADLISLSIGANDMLAAVEVLRLGFGAIRGEADTEKISQFNAARDAIDAITKVNSEPKEEDSFDSNLHGYRGASASTYASEYDTRDLIKKSFNKLVNMMEAGTLGGLFDIQQELLDHIFDLIQLDLANTIKEINAIAPNAKIIVMGYAFPFHLLPSTLVDAPIFQYDETRISSDRTPRTIDGKQVTLKDVFLHLNDTIKSTLERAKYVKFFNINELKEFSKESDTVTYTLQADGTEAAKTVTRPEWDRVMPNPLDIHPSTYGHQVVSGHLYQWVAQDLGLTVPEYQSIQKLDATRDAEQISSLEKIYTYTGPATGYHDAGFVQKDELVTYDSSMLLSAFDKLNDPEFLKTAAGYVKDYLDPQKIAENYQAVMDIFAGSATTGQKIERALDVVKKIVVDEHKELISAVIDLAKGFMDFDKLVNNIGDIISTVTDGDLTTTEKITKAADLIKASVKDASFGNVTGYKIADFIENLKRIILSCDFTKMPSNAGIADIIQNLATRVYEKRVDENGQTLWFNAAGEQMKNIFFTRAMINAFPGLTDAEKVAIDADEWYPQDAAGKVYWQKNLDGLVNKYNDQPTYNIGGIQVVEGIVGMMIYISSGNGHFGNLDKTSDSFYATFKPIIVSVLNSLSTFVGKGSISELLSTGLLAPLLDPNGAYLQDGTTPIVTPDGGANTDRFKAEMMTVAKSLGMDLTSVESSIEIDLVLADTALADALKAMGIK